MSLPVDSQSSDIRNRPEENNSLSVPQNQQKEQIIMGEDAEMVSGSDGVDFQYLKGLRLHLITVAICMTLFLTNLEIPIVTTALISITNDLHHFGQDNWIISAYMLGYVSMLIIWAKLSDIYGRKPFAVMVVLLFTIFSGLCGAAQTMTQLIVFRALQGLGGGGNFAIGTIILVELIPKELYPKYTGLVSVVFSFSLLLGPIFGGALNHSPDWRWIFLLNVPLAFLALAAFFFGLPASFPKIDFVGAILLIIATTLLVAALQEAGGEFAWNSAFVIILLIISGVTWILFILWERRVTVNMSSTEPVFPWRLMKSRVWIGMTLNALFLGGPWFVTIFQLPQRFQVVDGISALDAGFKLIPFTVLAPVGSVISAVLAGKVKVPPIYLVLIASCIQVIGFALLSTLPIAAAASSAQYGYQVIAGFGVGINISTLILMTPYYVADPRDKSVALGCVTQFRIMGGALGLAIVTAAYKGYVTSRLKAFLNLEEQLSVFESAKYIQSLSPEVQGRVREVFAGGYNLQFRILIALAAAQIPSSLLMWQKEQIVV
ncbi:major facilitator superfamily transporter [Botrytis cinerea]